VASDTQTTGGLSKRRTIFFAIVVLIAIIYVLFLLYQAVYFNYKTSQQIKDQKNKMQVLTSDQTRLETLIAYYGTSDFAELEARKKLGLMMPGEKVVKVDVPKSSAQATGSGLTVESPGVKKSNFQAWLDYLSGIDD
jgi:cell division protein FtsB